VGRKSLMGKEDIEGIYIEIGKGYERKGRLLYEREGRL
jgi:hypothetical protein